jgi:uncharacterized protein (TIGR02996 family)
MANDRTEGKRKRPAVVEEDRFIQAILADPDDTSIRLVYADWLEERGDPRGEFLRLEVALMNPPRDVIAWAGMAARLRRLRPTLDRDWLIALGREPIEQCELSFQFQCPKRWDHLGITPHVDVRFCPMCKRYVHYSHSIEQARRQASQGRCVAVDPTVDRKRGDLVPVRLRLVGRLLPPPPPHVPQISVRRPTDVPNREEDRPRKVRKQRRQRWLSDLLEDEDERPPRREHRRGRPRWR